MLDLPDPDSLVPHVLERCLRAIEPLEFKTFLIGVRVSSAGDRSDSELVEWKSQVKRKVCLALYDHWGETDRLPQFVKPEVLLIYDLDKRRVERKLESIYLYGRYQKLRRGLPQTEARWRCAECRGPGCEACDGTGKAYPVSLEDLLGVRAAQVFDTANPKRKRGYQLHGMGREDIDVLCVGGGRPFVMEIRNPRKRSGDLEALARQIVEESEGGVGLPVGLRLVKDSVVARVKMFEAPKRYRALCRPARAVGADELSALAAALTGTELSQQTPVRVKRSRKDMVRRRRVIAFEPRLLEGEECFEVEVEAQAGTYIKELISGDGGRTVPSVTALLGTPCECAQLDVLEIRCGDEDLLVGRQP